MGSKKFSSKYSYNFLQKNICFHADIDRERRLFELLDRVRSMQSKLVIRLLEDFFREFNLDSDTPYDHFVFVIKNYIENNPEDILAKTQVMNMMAQMHAPAGQVPMQFPVNYPFSMQNGYPVIMQPQSVAIAPDKPPVPSVHQSAAAGNDNNIPASKNSADDDDGFLNSLSAGFDSMLS